MKKVIIVLLVLALVGLAVFIGLVGCKKDDTGSTQPVETKDVFDIVANTKPATKIVTLTTYKSDKDTLNGKFTLTIAEGASKLEYNYDRYNTIEEALENGGDRILSVNGSVIYKDGLYSADGGKTWGAVAPAVEYTNLELNFDKTKFSDLVVGEKEITFIAKVNKENFISVFGVDFDTTEVTLTVATDGQNLRSVKIDYITTDMDIVVINTTYTYDTHSLSDILGQ